MIFGTDLAIKDLKEGKQKGEAKINKELEDFFDEDKEIIAIEIV